MPRKLQKAVTAVVSAVLCVAMVLGMTVSANDDDEYAMLWKETKPITNAKYYPQYIKMIEKYSKKESKNKIAYGKSKTKKLINKLAKTAAADEPEFSLSVTDDIMIAYFAVKGGNWKEVQCIGSYSSARYFTEDSSVLLDITEKKMADYHSETETEIREMCSELVTFYDFGIDDNAKGKYFKIKSNDKIYYYEEFQKEEGRSFGFLFDSKGRPLAFINDGASCCFIVSYSVDDSEFDIPSGYKKVKADDLNLNLSNRR